jgi:hypothetical protein
MMNRTLPARLPAAALIALFLFGCSAIITVSEYPFKQVATFIEAGTGQEKPKLTPVELENDLMRFADDLIAGTDSATHLLRDDGTKIERTTLLKFRIAFIEDVYQIATGPNSYANLLDMITLVTLTRIQVQDYWIPNRWGSSGQPLFEVLKSHEDTLWKVAKDVLKPDMVKELRVSIEAWASSHREIHVWTDVRASGFAATISHHDERIKTTDESKSSVFDLLDIDPLSSLDPATREIARTRQFAERAFFLAQRMPDLLRMQAELLTLTTAELPELKSLVSDATRLSLAVDSLSQTAHALPKDIATEREAVLKALREETGPIQALAEKVQATLDSGDRMFKSSDAALQSLNQFYAALEKNPRQPGEKPFDIGDYKAIAHDIAKTSEELNTLVAGLQNPGSSRTDQAGLLALSQTLDQRADHLAKVLLQTGLALIAALCCGLFLVLVGYRYVRERLGR